MPRRAGRRERARHGEQGDALAPEIFAAGGWLRAVGPGDGQRHVGQALADLDGHGAFSRGWMKRQIGSADRRLKACPRAFRQPIVLGGWNCRRFLSGKLLLAMPGMADPRFERAVIAMCVHDENGAIGIGVGHKRAGQFSRPAEAARYRTRRGARLRRSPWRPGRARPRLHPPFERLGRAGHAHVIGEAGRDIRDDRDHRRAPRDRGRARAPRWIAALGYAGWGEGQLDEEMTRHGWFAARGDARSCSTLRPTSAGRRRSRRKASIRGCCERDRRGLREGS